MSLPALKRFPFDSNNPIGYLMAVILEYIIFGYEYFVVAVLASFGIGSYYIAISIIKEHQRILNRINDEAHANGNQLKELKKLIAEFIHAHGFVKELSIVC